MTKDDKILEKGNKFVDDLGELMLKYQGEDMEFIIAFGLSQFARNYMVYNGVKSFKKYTTALADRHERGEW